MNTTELPQGERRTVMNQEDWKRVQEALKSLMNTVKLKIDGYEVALVLVRIGTYKNAIAIFVNGVFEGKWLMEDCEERRRFYQKCERSLYKQSEVKKLPKKMQKEMLSKKYEYYRSHWTSFGVLKKHLLQNNETIELISIGFE